MRILQINQNYNYGSTGRIMKEINDVILNEGHESYMLSAYSFCNENNLYVTECIPPKRSIYENILMPRLTGLTGYRKKCKTIDAIKWIDSINPDIIHLHNIHGDWINIDLLFEYIKKKDIPVVWTLHDCWSFTGRCSHFENAQCYKWKNGCYSCPNKGVYPITYFFDFSRKMWVDKKRMFQGVKNMHIVTPSNWLKKYVLESFLNGYETRTINNGIDVSIFHPNSKTALDSKNDKHIILGVASMWNKYKGLEDFIKLSTMLDETKYQIVLVGLNDRQLKILPSNITGIGRTRNIHELVGMYASASVFVNPTYQDNYPTVNLESIASGTPVITYRTGGSVESVSQDNGIIVEQGDVIALKDAIEIVCHNLTKYSSGCREYAVEHFDKTSNYLKYLELYTEIFKE